MEALPFNFTCIPIIPTRIIVCVANSYLMLHQNANSVFHSHLIQCAVFSDRILQEPENRNKVANAASANNLIVIPSM